CDVGRYHRIPEWYDNPGPRQVHALEEGAPGDRCQHDRTADDQSEVDHEKAVPGSQGRLFQATSDRHQGGEYTRHADESTALHQPGTTVFRLHLRAEALIRTPPC